MQYTLGGSKRNQVFSVHLYKVLKQCHPENVGISKKGMHVLNSLMFDIFEQIVLEAYNILRMTKKRTMTALTVQAAVKLVLTGELAKYAISKGTKVVYHPWK